MLRQEDEWRVTQLLQISAARHWLSLDPLLGPVTLRPSWFRHQPPQFSHRGIFLGGLDWVIVGGESGPGARPMHPDWAEGIRDQCVGAGVAFFFKQWGKFVRCDRCNEHGETWDWRDKKAPPKKCDKCNGTGYMLSEKSFAELKINAGHLLDGREWREFP